MRTQRRRAAVIAASLIMAGPLVGGLVLGTAALANHTYYNEEGAYIGPGPEDEPVLAEEEVAVEAAPVAAYVATGTNYGLYEARGYGAWMAEAMAALRRCESGNNYGINTGNGYYGAYQFSASTWSWLGYAGLPHQATPQVQDQAALDLYEIYGWSPWPGCSWWLGLR